MSIEYIIPDSVDEIYEKLYKRSAYFVAGGTDIMVMKKNGTIEDFRPWVDISGLQALKGIREENGYMDIGALCTMTDISSSDIISEKALALHEAAFQMGSPLIRNIATIGGNIANSNPAGDMLPPLTALGAVIVIQKGFDKREYHAGEFCTCPGGNVLEPGEIITRIKIPVEENSLSGFMKLGPRKALAISKVSVAAWWIKEGKEIKDIRIALGAVGARCLRAKNAENMLRGKKPGPDLLKEAFRMVRTDCSAIDDFRSTIEYREKMAGVLLKRILRRK